MTETIKLNSDHVKRQSSDSDRIHKKVTIFSMSMKYFFFVDNLLEKKIKK